MSFNNSKNTLLNNIILEELNPLIEELQEGIAQMALIHYIPYNDILAKVAVKMMDTGE